MYSCILSQKNSVVLKLTFITHLWSVSHLLLRNVYVIAFKVLCNNINILFILFTRHIASIVVAFNFCVLCNIFKCSCKDEYETDTLART